VITDFLFDLDGTLVDSSADIIHCLKSAYAAASFPLPITVVRSFIGPPLNELIRLVSPGISNRDAEAIQEHFRTCYDKSTMARTIFMEGASDTLELLKIMNRKMYLVTNKPKKPTEIILNNLNIDCFCDIMTPDVQPGRILSKPEMVALVMMKWGLDSRFTGMVGDTAHDVKAARENGIISIIVKNGYGNEQTIRESRPEHLIDNLSAFGSLIEHVLN
jgi:phosphoglycolate phosphatase